MTDLEMLQQPMEWPGWPVLPLKRWDKVKREQEYSFLLAQEDMLCTIHYGSIFDVERVNLAARGQGKSQSYVSHEAIIADGWQVD